MDFAGEGAMEICYRGETSQVSNHGLKCALDGVTSIIAAGMVKNSTNPGGCFECCQCAFLGGMMVNHGSG
jgi:hypothetical protein